MNIEIKIENKVVEVILLNEGQVVDMLAIVQEHRLSEDLLPTVDELLKKNQLESGDIAKMTVQSDLGENFTTYRIAAAVANAFNWANAAK